MSFRFIYKGSIGGMLPGLGGVLSLLDILKPVLAVIEVLAKAAMAVLMLIQIPIKLLIDLLILLCAGAVNGLAGIAGLVDKLSAEIAKLKDASINGAVIKYRFGNQIGSKLEPVGNFPEAIETFFKKGSPGSEFGPELRIRAVTIFTTSVSAIEGLLGLFGPQKAKGMVRIKFDRLWSEIFLYFPRDFAFQVGDKKYLPDMRAIPFDPVTQKHRFSASELKRHEEAAKTAKGVARLRLRHKDDLFGLFLSESMCLRVGDQLYKPLLEQPPFQLDTSKAWKYRGWYWLPPEHIKPDPDSLPATEVESTRLPSFYVDVAIEAVASGAEYNKPAGTTLELVDMTGRGPLMPASSAEPVTMADTLPRAYGKDSSDLALGWAVTEALTGGAPPGATYSYVELEVVAPENGAKYNQPKDTALEAPGLEVTSMGSDVKPAAIYAHTAIAGGIELEPPPPIKKPRPPKPGETEVKLIEPSKFPKTETSGTIRDTVPIPRPYKGLSYVGRGGIGAQLPLIEQLVGLLDGLRDILQGIADAMAHWINKNFEMKLGLEGIKWQFDVANIDIENAMADAAYALAKLNVFAGFVGPAFAAGDIWIFKYDGAAGNYGRAVLRELEAGFPDDPKGIKRETWALMLVCEDDVTWSVFGSLFPGEVDAGEDLAYAPPADPAATAQNTTLKSYVGYLFATKDDKRVALVQVEDGAKPVVIYDLERSYLRLSRERFKADYRPATGRGNLSPEQQKNRSTTGFAGPFGIAVAAQVTAFGKGEANPIPVAQAAVTTDAQSDADRKKAEEFKQAKESAEKNAAANADLKPFLGKLFWFQAPDGKWPMALVSIGAAGDLPIVMCKPYREKVTQTEGPKPIDVYEMKADYVISTRQALLATDPVTPADLKSYPAVAVAMDGRDKIYLPGKTFDLFGEADTTALTALQQGATPAKATT